jgi:hypothetical protein
MSDAIAAVVWQSVTEPETQQCLLSRDSDGWRLAGTVVTAANREPALITYQVDVDDSWVTRRAAVEVTVGVQSPVRIRFAVDAGGRWSAERQPEPDAPRVTLPELAGLTDIDLAFTPATNTLPIRRLRPEVGETVDVVAAWLRFPELVIEPLPQTYRRLDQRRYHYESGGGAFTAVITVDEHGLVVGYDGLWTRAAP